MIVCIMVNLKLSYPKTYNNTYNFLFRFDVTISLIDGLKIELL